MANQSEKNSRIDPKIDFFKVNLKTVKQKDFFVKNGWSKILDSPRVYLIRVMSQWFLFIFLRRADRFSSYLSRWIFSIDHKKDTTTTKNHT